MNKALKSLSLILFSICSILGFNLSADALTLDSDMSASDITIQSGDVIDGQKINIRLLVGLILKM